jgi:hypothetical protein
MTLAQLIVARSKRDPEFKRQVLTTLRKHLASLQRAIQALEDLK